VPESDRPLSQARESGVLLDGGPDRRRRPAGLVDGDGARGEAGRLGHARGWAAPADLGAAADPASAAGTSTGERRRAMRIRRALRFFGWKPARRVPDLRAGTYNATTRNGCRRPCGRPSPASACAPCDGAGTPGNPSAGPWRADRGSRNGGDAAGCARQQDRARHGDLGAGGGARAGAAQGYGHRRHAERGDGGQRSAARGSSRSIRCRCSSAPGPIRPRSAAGGSRCGRIRSCRSRRSGGS